MSDTFHPATFCRVYLVSGTSTTVPPRPLHIECQMVPLEEGSDTITVGRSAEMFFTEKENDNFEIQVGELIDLVWTMYDMDRDNVLNAKELKNLINDYTEHPVSEESALTFLQSIDEDGDNVIERSELSHFIEKGLRMSQKTRKTYRDRGEFHKTVVEFFEGVDKQRKLLAEERRLEHLSKLNRTPSPKKKSKAGRVTVDQFLNSIWDTFDLDRDKNLNPQELKTLFRAYTGSEVTEKDTTMFLDSIDKDGNRMISQEELTAFIKQGMKLPTKARKTYMSRGQFHKKVITFFDTFRGAIKKMQDDRDMKISMIGKEITVETWINTIWSKYDLDQDDNLNSEELSVFFSDLTKIEIDSKETKQFLDSVDEDGNGLIDRDELAEYIERGMNLSENEIRGYLKRGKFHKKVVALFQAAKEELKTRREDRKRSEHKKKGLKAGSFGFLGSELIADISDSKRSSKLVLNLMDGANNKIGESFLLPFSKLVPFKQYQLKHRFMQSHETYEINMVVVAEEALEDRRKFSSFFELSAFSIAFDNDDPGHTSHDTCLFVKLSTEQVKSEVETENMLQFTSTEGDFLAKCEDPDWQTNGRVFLVGGEEMSHQTFPILTTPAVADIFYFRFNQFGNFQCLGKSLLKGSEVRNEFITENLSISGNNLDGPKQCSLTYTSSGFCEVATSPPHTIHQANDDASPPERIIGAEDTIVGSAIRVGSESRVESRFGSQGTFSQQPRRSQKKNRWSAEELAEENEKLRGIVQSSQEEIQHLKEREDETAAYNEELISSMRSRIESLEDQILDVDDIIQGKSKELKKMETLNLKLRRKLTKAPKIEKVKELEMDAVRLKAIVKASEKTNNTLLNRLEQVQKKRYGYVPKRSAKASSNNSPGNNNQIPSQHRGRNNPSSNSPGNGNLVPTQRNGVYKQNDWPQNVNYHTQQRNGARAPMNQMVHSQSLPLLVHQPNPAQIYYQNGGPNFNKNSQPGMVQQAAIYNSPNYLHSSLPLIETRGDRNILQDGVIMARKNKTMDPNSNIYRAHALKKGQSFPITSYNLLQASSLKQIENDTDSIDQNWESLQEISFHELETSANSPQQNY